MSISGLGTTSDRVTLSVSSASRAMLSSRKTKGIVVLFGALTPGRNVPVLFGPMPDITKVRLKLMGPDFWTTRFSVSPSVIV